MILSQRQKALWKFKRRKDPMAPTWRFFGEISCKIVVKTTAHVPSGTLLTYTIVWSKKQSLGIVKNNHFSLEKPTDGPRSNGAIVSLESFACAVQQDTYASLLQHQPSDNTLHHHTPFARGRKRQSCCCNKEAKETWREPIVPSFINHWEKVSIRRNITKSTTLSK